MKLTAAIYRGLVMARHPESIALWHKGIDYDHYRGLRKPWLQSKRIGTVLDVGANVGQFARLAHAVWPSAAIHSFEPLPDCFELLRRAFSPGADFHPWNLGLGDENGTLKIERCGHSPSSSFLPMTQAHREAFPESAGGGDSQVKVSVRQLDDIVSQIDVRGSLLIKVDVQGYELHVIRGGRQTFGRANVVLIETSYLPLYVGQPLFAEVYDEMRLLGFEFRGNLHQMLHPVDGRIVQADSLFERRDGIEGRTA
jgi:FkbM family methyltransferase